MKGGSSSTEKKSFNASHLLLLHICDLGDVGNSCKYFKWADEEVTEDVSTTTDSTVDDLKAKNAKLKLKLMAERKAGKMKTYLVVFAWFFSFVVLAFCALKCNCNLN
ncbi:hypothetical protein SESBI_45705 [Sesbania bispinosa]|nr:hypothetical protein SESBI_45705 [Sesbania bispinosa]